MCIRDSLDGVLADVLGQLVNEIKGLLGGVGSADDLHQLHGGHGVEEVHSDDGVLQAVAHLGEMCIRDRSYAHGRATVRGE